MFPYSIESMVNPVCENINTPKNMLLYERQRIFPRNQRISMHVEAVALITIKKTQQGENL